MGLQIREKKSRLLCKVQLSRVLLPCRWNYIMHMTWYHTKKNGHGYYIFFFKLFCYVVNVGHDRNAIIVCNNETSLTFMPLNLFQSNVIETNEYSA